MSSTVSSSHSRVTITHIIESDNEEHSDPDIAIAHAARVSFGDIEADFGRLQESRCTPYWKASAVLTISTGVSLVLGFGLFFPGIDQKNNELATVGKALMGASAVFAACLAYSICVAWEKEQDRNVSVQ